MASTHHCPPCARRGCPLRTTPRVARLPYHWEMRWQARQYLARQSRELLHAVQTDARAEREERLAKELSELDTEDACPGPVTARWMWPTWLQVAQAVGLAAASVATLLILILGWMRVLG